MGRAISRTKGLRAGKKRFICEEGSKKLGVGKLSRVMAGSGIALSELCLPSLDLTNDVFKRGRSRVRACSQRSFQIENGPSIGSELVRNKTEIQGIQRGVFLLCVGHCLTHEFMCITKWNAFSDKVVGKISGEK